MSCTCPRAAKLLTVWSCPCHPPKGRFIRRRPATAADLSLRCRTAAQERTEKEGAGAPYEPYDPDGLNKLGPENAEALGAVA